MRRKTAAYVLTTSEFRLTNKMEVIRKNIKGLSMAFQEPKFRMRRRIEI